MQLYSLGAATTVTGSMHLLALSVQGKTRHMLIDAGLFQGTPSLEAHNAAPFAFDPQQLEAVVLTHGHLDHVGRLPLLTRRGYRGPIFCTAPTAKLAEVVLLDAMRLQDEQHQEALKRARKTGQEADVPAPLYEEKDVHDVLNLLRPVLCYGQSHSVAGCRLTPYRAGHILGSAYVLIESDDGRLLMSGDLGNRESALQHHFMPPPAADVVVIESTYANKTHPPFAQTLAALQEAILRGLRRGGKILIPVFAIERSQTILFLLRELMEMGGIPRLPIFLDSPMATKATQQYREHGEELHTPVSHLLEQGKDPFATSSLHVIHTRAESQRLNKYDGPAIILAGNGMMTGGRIQHHLRQHLTRPDCTVLMVSYQSPSSIGGQLLAGASQVELLGDTLEVAAHIEQIRGLSAHADQDDLLSFLQQTGAKRVWLTHGERNVMEDFLPVLAAQGYWAAPVPLAEWVKL